MVISCDHKCQKSVDECLRCLRTQVESKGVHDDDRMRVIQAWGHEV